MLYTLPKPDLAKLSSKEITDALSNSQLIDFIKKYSDKEYLYWDKIRYKEPAPKDISKEVIWKTTKIFRESRFKSTPIKDKYGKFFSWIKLDYFDEFFHELDLYTKGEFLLDPGETDLTKQKKQKLIIHGIMEEAIASSQLEGAATSRKAAKKILQEGLKPKNKSEQMIVNNYLAIKSLEENYLNVKMSLDLIIELHELITKNTLDSADEIPRMRKINEPIFITDGSRGNIYFEAPKIKFVKKEIARLILFANDELDEDVFIHPIIKALVLHFWFAYLHPFTDGNGRMARLIFYWYLLRNDYSAFAYLPISKAIKKAPQQYIMSYVYSEQDDNDLTYFLDLNIKKIKLAILDFKEYLAKLKTEKMQLNFTKKLQYDLNMRQVQLLQYLHNDPDKKTNLKSYININQITKMTGIKDLKGLVAKGFIIGKKQGRNIFYHASDKTKFLFQE